MRIAAQMQHAMHVACAQHALEIYLTKPSHALQVHPDLFQDPDARATNERSFKLLQEYLAAGLLHPVLWACCLQPQALRQLHRWHHSALPDMQHTAPI